MQRKQKFHLKWHLDVAYLHTDMNAFNLQLQMQK